MWGAIAYMAAKTAVASFQGYNSARQSQIQLEMQADTARYNAAVAEINAGLAKQDIINIGETAGIARSIYGQQAAAIIAQTRTSAASRGVVMSTGSAAATTAGAEFAAQRDLYSMSMQTLQQIQQKRHEVLNYQIEANTNTIMASAYEDMADEINPWASGIAAGAMSLLNLQSSQNSLSSTQLINYAQPTTTTTTTTTSNQNVMPGILSYNMPSSSFGGTYSTATSNALGSNNFSFGSIGFN